MLEFIVDIKWIIFQKLKQEVDELRELYSDIKKQLKKTQNELADAVSCCLLKK